MKKDFDEMLACELALRMGKFTDTDSIVESAKEMLEEYSCFSF